MHIKELLPLIETMGWTLLTTAIGLQCLLRSTEDDLPDSRRVILLATGSVICLLMLLFAANATKITI